MNKIERTKYKRLILVVFTLMVGIPYAHAADEEIILLRTIETPNPEDHGWFGYPLDMDGDLMVISEWRAEVDEMVEVGRAYVYDTDGNLVSTLQSTTPHSGQVFSASVDILGDHIIIGDYSIKDGVRQVGKAYLYNSEGTLITTIESPTPKKGGFFSRGGLCLTPDMILVSEMADTDPAGAGIVHIYDYQGVYLKSISSPSPKASSGFGSLIKYENDLILISEFGEYAREKNYLAGTVYGFNTDGNHVLTLQAPEPKDDACFGKHIATYDDKIVISEYYATVNDVFRAGKVHIFNTEGELLRTIISPFPETNAQFGKHVDIDGDTIVVGEYNANVEPDMYEGKAHVFDTEGNHLSTLISPSPSRKALYGLSVNIEDDIIVIGEPWATINGEEKAGKVYVYTWGTPETDTPEVVETPTVSEPETTSDDTDGGIPGFPVNAIASSLIITAYLIHYLSRKR